jgi:hypothetical protein
VVHHVIERSMFRTRLQETKRLAFCRRTVLETHVCMCQIRAYRGPGPLRCSIGKLGRNWGLKAPLQSGKRLTAFRSEKSFRYSGCGRMGSGKLHVAPIVGNSCVLICLVRPRHFRVSAGNLSLEVVCLVDPFFPWSESKRDACGRAAVWPLHKAA